MSWVPPDAGRPAGTGYPFILLNLSLAMLAAIQAPVIISPAARRDPALRRVPAFGPGWSLRP
jgi:hypothetical protein